MTKGHSESNLTVVKESLQSIVKHLTTAPKARPTNDVKAAVSKIHNLVLYSNNPLEKFYFITLLCKHCSKEKPNKVDRLIKVVLPAAPTPQTMSLMSDIISFALCHPTDYSTILDNLSSYLSASDAVKIDIESWMQAVSLALESPHFCSALLSRPDLPLMGIDKRLIAKWLQDLSKTEQEFPPVNLSHIIRYSLFESQLHTISELFESQSDKTNKVTTNMDTSDSDLHYCILTLIQSKRCMTLTNQFLIEIANTLAQRLRQQQEGGNDMNVILDRFGQILSVAAASKATTLTSTFRNALTALDSNHLIAAIIKWQTK